MTADRVTGASGATATGRGSAGCAAPVPGSVKTTSAAPRSGVLRRTKVGMRLLLLRTIQCVHFERGDR
jgi:hypothetical protein